MTKITTILMVLFNMNLAFAVVARIENCSSKNKIKFQKAYDKMLDHNDSNKGNAKYTGKKYHKVIEVKYVDLVCMSESEMIDIGYGKNKIGT
jgi:hypothetical protein